MKEYGKILVGSETMIIEVGSYISGGNVCVDIICEDGISFANLSVNLHGHSSSNIEQVGLEKNEFVINHNLYNNSYGSKYLASFLLSGIFEDTGKKCNYGFCRDIPIWRLLDKLNGESKC